MFTCYWEFWRTCAQLSWGFLGFWGFGGLSLPPLALFCLSLPIRSNAFGCLFFGLCGGGVGVAGVAGVVGGVVGVGGVGVDSIFFQRLLICI